MFATRKEKGETEKTFARFETARETRKWERGGGTVGGKIIDK